MKVWYQIYLHELPISEELKFADIMMRKPNTCQRTEIQLILLSQRFCGFFIVTEMRLFIRIS